MQEFGPKWPRQNQPSNNSSKGLMLLKIQTKTANQDSLETFRYEFMLSFIELELCLVVELPCWYLSSKISNDMPFQSANI